ncbi:HIT family protein [Haloglomus litoreum]|uniref:HIT family protein n=1 Tax=Haloglomus litoreum TaxID=3034026 RepID=UPI0023E76299|nr:HIT domain-containing protein [Haloglomus sp. DT116]
MDQMFAPWRLEWVQRDDREETFDGCVLCGLADGDDREHRILARNDHAYVVLNNAPYAPGHSMVVPTDHVGEYHHLDETTMLALDRLQSATMETLENVYAPQGFNVGMNIGKAGGASIEDHLHVHVVPRWEGDATFMPTTADTQVIVEALDESYEKLRKEFRRVAGAGGVEPEGAIRVDG